MPQLGKPSRLSVGKTVEEVHADVVAEGHDVTVEEIEEKLRRWWPSGSSKKPTFPSAICQGRTRRSLASAARATSK